MADPEKDKWNFYIRFKISKPLGIDLNSTSLNDKFIIKSDSDSSLKEVNILRVECSEPLIYREICEFPKMVEQVMIITFAELGVGIAYAKSLASESIVDNSR